MRGCVIHLIVCCPCAVNGPKALLEVNVKPPELEASIEPLLDWKGPLLFWSQSLEPVTSVYKEREHEESGHATRKGDEGSGKVRSPFGFLCRLLDEIECPFELIVPQLHLDPLCPHLCEVLKVLVTRSTGLFKDHPGVGEISVFLIKASKGAPEGVGLTHCLSCRKRGR